MCPDAAVHPSNLEIAPPKKVPSIEELQEFSQKFKMPKSWVKRSATTDNLADEMDTYKQRLKEGEKAGQEDEIRVC